MLHERTSCELELPLKEDLLRDLSSGEYREGHDILRIPAGLGYTIVGPWRFAQMYASWRQQAREQTARWRRVGPGARPLAAHGARPLGRVQLTWETTGQKVDHCHRDPSSADRFPNGYVLSWPLRPRKGNGQSAFCWSEG